MRKGAVSAIMKAQQRSKTMTQAYKLPRTVGDWYSKRIEANVWLWYIMLECGHESLIGKFNDRNKSELIRRRCYKCLAKEK